MRKGYTCLILNFNDRQRLLELFPPQYSQTIAHHVTMEYGVTGENIPDVWDGFVVGDAYDKGVQALVVQLNGTTVRQDGAVFHITWSLDIGRFPEESKPLLERGWYPLDQPIPVYFTPAFVLSKGSRP
jgi:hypothetical protein